MIDVERRRMIRAPAATIKAVLNDIEHVQRLMPRVEKVEVQGQTENRARLAIHVRAGPLGSRRLDGEARLLDDGLRFVMVRPAQIDSRWVVRERGDVNEVIAYLSIDLSGLLGSLGRWLPRRVIEARIGDELDASLQALDELSHGER